MTALMADLVAQQQEGEELSQHITEKAKQLLAEILLPKQITGKLIEKYIRKAMRTGAWRKLPPQTKALLYIAKKFAIFKSVIMKKIIQKILISIELQTINGKALYYGIIHIKKKIILHNYFNTSIDINPEHISEKKETLLVIGISAINNSIEKYF